MIPIGVKFDEKDTFASNFFNKGVIREINVYCWGRLYVYDIQKNGTRGPTFDKIIVMIEEERH